MEPDELTLKFTWKSQGPRMALNKNKVEGGGVAANYSSDSLSHNHRNSVCSWYEIRK